MTRQVHKSFDITLAQDQGQEQLQLELKGPNIRNGNPILVAIAMTKI